MYEILKSMEQSSENSLRSKLSLGMESDRYVHLNALMLAYVITVIHFVYIGETG